MRFREKTNNTSVIRTVTRKHPDNVQPSEPNIELYRSIDSVLSTVTDIFGQQVDRFRIKSSLSAGLNHVELKNLVEIMKALTALQKHQHELSKTDALTDKLKTMTDEQLLEYAKTIIGDKVLELEPEPVNETT
jgi:hypothetical protein